MSAAVGGPAKPAPPLPAGGGADEDAWALDAMVGTGVPMMKEGAEEEFAPAAPICFQAVSPPAR
ncbi:MAG: hypothetical protein NTW28_28935 [Candidatus Solibacter sp.]|nr:hypothetical protein [Candidatus Solibacter sp.]